MGTVRETNSGLKRRHQAPFTGKKCTILDPYGDLVRILKNLGRRSDCVMTKMTKLTLSTVLSIYAPPPPTPDKGDFVICFI